MIIYILAYFIKKCFVQIEKRNQETAKTFKFQISKCLKFHTYVFNRNIFWWQKIDFEKERTKSKVDSVKNNDSYGDKKVDRDRQ